MPTPGIPPPPPGYEPIAASDAPPPPPGYSPVDKPDDNWFPEITDAVRGVGAGVIHTGTGLYNLARKIPGVGSVLPEPSNEVRQAGTPPPSTAGKVGYGAEQVGEFMLPAGAVGRGAKAIEGATAGMRGAGLLNTAGRAALEGASAAGVTAAQTGGDAGQMARAGTTAGAVSAAVPVVSKVVGAVAPAVLGRTTGAGEEAIRTAASNPSPAFMNAMRGNVDEGDLVGAVRDALGKVKEQRGNDYRARLAAISNLGQPQPGIGTAAQVANQPGGFPPIDITPVRQQLAQKLQDFRVLPSQGGLDFSRSVIPKAEQATVEAIAQDVFGWDDYTPLGVDALKRRISNYYSHTSDVRALTSAVENATKKVLATSVPGYSEMTQGYANASDFIKKVEQEFAVGPTAQQGTAIRRISYALKQNNEYRKALAEALDVFANSDVKDQIAGYHLKDTLPKGLTGVASGVGILGAIGMHALSPDAAVAMMASSPRLVGETLAAMSKLQNAGPAVAAAAPKAAAAFTVNRDKPTPQFAEGGVVTTTATQKAAVAKPKKKRRWFGPPAMPKSKSAVPPPMPFAK